VFLVYSNLYKGYKCLNISTDLLYIYRDIVFEETVFPFATLHSNVGARLRPKIDLLPLSLHPFNLHHREVHELQEPVGVNPTNAANIAAESFLQDADHVYASDTDSGKNFIPTLIPELIRLLALSTDRASLNCMSAPPRD
jgi:hypothetical protein